MAIPTREEIVRIDCNFCNGNGYKIIDGEESPCDTCGGVGMREKRMPWKPEGYSNDEKMQIFGVSRISNRPDKDDPANL